jgi:polar amino acid transport system permease protein
MNVTPSHDAAAGGGPAGPAAPPAPTRPPSTTPEAIKAVPVRHYGRWVGAVIVLLLALWLVTAAAGTKNIHWDQIPTYLFNENILEGLRNTLLISLASMAVGVVLGVIFAVMRLSPNPVLSTVSWFYIWIFRGTPVYLQLIIWFNLALVFQTVTLAIPGTDITLFTMPMNEFMTPFMAALLGLGLNEGAYMAEIVRGGIQSVDEGQTEAANALGMTQSQTMRRIVLPQAMRVIIPPTGNEFVSMLKLSSLATVVVFGELLRKASDIYTSNLLILELLFTISIWYLAVTTVASIGQYFLERRFSRGTSRNQRPLPFAQTFARVRARGRAGSGGDAGV